MIEFKKIGHSSTNIIILPINGELYPFPCRFNGFFFVDRYRSIRNLCERKTTAS